MPFELKWGGAALLNISLLASDVWAALARYLWFGARSAAGPSAAAPAAAASPGRTSCSTRSIASCCWLGSAPLGCVTRHAAALTSAPARAGGFQGYSLPFFAASLVVVACGIALFTACGDVDTQLGAGSSGASPALPVVYQRVPGGAGPGTKLPQEALEELQRQGQQLREAPAVPLPNPFELPRGGGSGGRPGFMPLLAEEAWPSSDQGGSPAAVHAAPGAPAAVTGTPTSPVVELAGRQSFDAGSAR